LFLGVSCELVGVVSALETPTLSSPANNSSLQDAYVPLIVNINSTGELQTVSFYNASNDVLIGNVTLVNASQAGVVWQVDFGYHTWYAVASNGTASVRSDTFNFTTVEAVKPAARGEWYISNESHVSYSNVSNTSEFFTLIIMPYVDTMGQWFYAIIVFLFVGLVFLKTQTAFIPSVMLLFSGLTLNAVLPGETHVAVLGMMVLGFTGIVFSLFGRRV
jgi:hypothetical protein